MPRGGPGVTPRMGDSGGVARGGRGRFQQLFDFAVVVTVLAVLYLWYATIFTAEIYLHGAHFLSDPSGLFLHDFADFWGGGRLAWMGRVDVIFDPARFDQWLSGHVAAGSMPEFSTWSYPPPMLLPLLPFGLLPLPVAYIAWLGSTFALLAWVLWCAIPRGWIVALVVLSPPALYTLQYAQNGALTAALLIGGIWLVDRRPVAAGICAGLLIIKPQLAILLPFAYAAGGYWRAFLAAACAALLMIGGSVALFGPGAWVSYVTTTAPAMTAQLYHSYGIAPQMAMPTTFVTLQGWGLSNRGAMIGQAASSLVAIAVTLWAWSRRPGRRYWRNALTCALPLLATPFGYVYDAIPAMLAIVLAAEAGFSTGFARLERPVLVGAWLWPAFAVRWAFYWRLPPLGCVLLLALMLCLMGRLCGTVGRGAVAPGEAEAATP